MTRLSAISVLAFQRSKQTWPQEEEQQYKEKREGSSVFWLKDRATENVSKRAHLQTFEWKTLEGFTGHNRNAHIYFLGWLIPSLAWALILFSSAFNEIVKCVTVWLMGRGRGGFGSLDFPMTHMQFKIVSQYVATVWVFVNAFCVTFNWNCSPYLLPHSLSLSLCLLPLQHPHLPQRHQAISVRPLLL